jgi:predicted patatin/cPLA2 family phospholipase
MRFFKKLIAIGLAFTSFIIPSSALFTGIHLSNFFKADTYSTKDTCNILALTGGGSYGAVQVGILDSLITENKIPNNFDIVTGISAGALNAAFLSYYSNISHAIPDLRQIVFDTKTANVYKKDYFNVFSRWSIYDNAPLELTLKHIISNKLLLLNSIRNYKTTTLIGATNVINEVLDVYDYGSLDYDNKINLLMSTTSIPFIFPPRVMNDQMYIDGGVISNEMIYQALGWMRCKNVSVVVISGSFQKKNEKKIDGFLSYIGRVIKLLMNTFDNQLAEIVSTKCETPIGVLEFCYPDSDIQVSILDFEKGKELYEIGKKSRKCEKEKIC